MALQKTRLGTNEDGTPQYHYQGEHLVYTGPHIEGEVTLADGSKVDVTELYVEAESPAHALQISDAIGKHFAKIGHPVHAATATAPEVPFFHTPSSVTHDKDGKPSAKFTDAVVEHVPDGKDSKPEAVMARVTRKAV